MIDGRGSGYRGDDLLFEIYYSLGGPEVQDQIEVTRRLVNLYSFIDRNNVAIWGWSYGGREEGSQPGRRLILIARGFINLSRDTCVTML